MSNITSLITAGPDAFTNLYDVIFDLPDAISGVVEGYSEAVATSDMTVRVQDFPFPQLAPDKYPVAYKGIVLTRLKPKIVGDRKFTLTFRVDANWRLYSKLKAWKKLYMDEYNAEINFDHLVETGGTGLGGIRVRAYNSNTKLSSVVEPNTSVDAGPEWAFKQVICKNIDEPQFTRENAEPILVKAEFLFGEYIPPFES